MFLDPYREYYKPDIFTFGGDKVRMDFNIAGQSVYQNKNAINCFSTASVGRVFDVYRIKIFENRDRQEDVEAKCRHYSSEAGQTYRDCVLASIKHNFEVSR